MLQCGCFDDPTQVTLINLHSSGDGDAAGAFGLLNLDSQQDGGNIGSDTLADWIRDGFQDDLPLGTYDSAPSANFNSGNIKDALDDRIGEELLPVYREPIVGSGSGPSTTSSAGWVSSPRRTASAEAAVRSAATSRRSSGRASPTKRHGS